MAINGKIERLCRLHRSMASVDDLSKLVVLLLFIEILLFIGASANCGVKCGGLLSLCFLYSTLCTF